MYSLLSTLFVIGVFLVVAGFLSRVGTDGISDVSENIAAVAFLDTDILFAAIEIIMPLPLTQGSTTGKFMVNLFIGIVVAIALLLLLNYVI